MRWVARGALVLVVAGVISMVGLVVQNPNHANALPTVTFASVDCGGGITAPTVEGCTAAISNGSSQTDCPKKNLLGVFIPWYEYLEVGKDDTGSCAVLDFHLLPGNGHRTDVPLVLLAIVDNLLRFAGLAAVIFVVYGGIMYATSQGNPDATSKAQSTVLQALIGLVIALVAVAFVSYLGRALG